MEIHPVRKQTIWRNLIPILIVSCAGAVIYMLPYFRYDYYDAYLAAYHLSDSQMGMLGTMYGIFGMISYLFGGLLADRISVKLLLVFSLLGTALGGFLHLLPLTYTAMIILYAAWGFTSLFAFWPATVKAVRMLAPQNDQGKAFGFFEGGRGIFAALIASAAVAVFALAGGKENLHLGMYGTIIFYSVATALSGFLVLFFFREDHLSQATQETALHLKDVMHVLRLPSVWLISLITLCGYIFTMSLYYFTPYSTQFFAFSVAGAALLAAVRRYISPFASSGSGFFIDRFGTGPVFLCSFIMMAACTAGILLLPLSSAMTIPFIVIYIANYIFLCVNYGLTWSMLQEGRIPERLSGTASGVISTVGYLPDVFCPIIAGLLLENNVDADGITTIAGYRQYFLFVIAALLLGALLVLLWQRWLKKESVPADITETERPS